MAARAVGAATIIATDINESRLDLARELGATHTMLASRPDLAAALAEASAGTLNYAIDSTARPGVIRAAADALGRRGILGLVGASAPGDELSFDAGSIMDGGRVLRGIVEGDADPQVFIPKWVALHAKGRFPFDRLIRYYPFEDINEALSDAQQGRTVKDWHNLTALLQQDLLAPPSAGPIAPGHLSRLARAHARGQYTWNALIVRCFSSLEDDRARVCEFADLAQAHGRVCCRARDHMRK
jgi:hypothetical protein